MGAAFVGRDHEQAELLAGLQDALGGRGGVFLVTGEPGIGKTALAEHLAGVATARGVRVVWSRAWQGDDATPYQAWAQIVRSLLEGLDEEALGSLLQPGVARLGRLVPELAHRVEDDDSSIPGAESDAARCQLFEGIAGFLKRISSGQPRLHALKRIATPEEIARSVLYLASHQSSFTTGSTLFADGGVSISRT